MVEEKDLRRRIFEGLWRLPPDAQMEVLHFIDFLCARFAQDTHRRILPTEDNANPPAMTAQTMLPTQTSKASPSSSSSETLTQADIEEAKQAWWPFETDG